MISKYTENESGVVVEVEKLDEWEPYGLWVSVTYPHAGLAHSKKYAIPLGALNQHFTALPVTNIEIFAAAGVYERPTEAQRKLE